MKIAGALIKKTINH